MVASRLEVGHTAACIPNGYILRTVSATDSKMDQLIAQGLHIHSMCILFTFHTTPLYKSPIIHSLIQALTSWAPTLRLKLYINA